MKIEFTTLSANESDAERAIIPALIYTKQKQNDLIGHMISVGWWAWGIGVIFMFESTKNE